MLPLYHIVDAIVDATFIFVTTRYLSNRKQIVSINNCNSKLSNNDIRVTQGSTFDSLLFLVSV